MDKYNDLLEQEPLIVVNSNDDIVSYQSKRDCHRGGGLLHRAFSIFIFNDQNELLIQKRSAEKFLWPLFWSNSVCSHPRKDEEYEKAAYRRLNEELGIKTALHFLFKFQYRARYNESGSENEICAVFIGKFNGIISPNQNEIDGWKYIDIETLNRDIHLNTQSYTPWFKMEWDQIRKNHNIEINSL
jgi:isopentenyl-diphosphate Delta-isomerase